MPSGVSLTDPWAQSFFGHRPRKALQDWISFGHLRRSTQFESTTGTFHQRRAATRSGSVPFHWPMKLQAGLWCFLLQSSRTKSTKISQQMSTGSRDRLSSESHEFTFSVRSLSCVFGGGSLIVSRLFRGCLPSLQSIQLVYHLKQMSSGLKRSISSTEMRTIVPWFGWSSCVCSAHVCPP